MSVERFNLSLKVVRVFDILGVLLLDILDFVLESVGFLFSDLKLGFRVNFNSR